MPRMNKPCIPSLTALALAGALFLTTGCKSSSQSTAPPPTPQQLEEMRNTFGRGHPDVRVGEVIAVLPSSHLAQVADVPLKDFTVGDIISFIDSSDNTVAMGRVEAVKPDSLIVHYDVSAQNGRDPLIGDAAVRAFH
jgi:hypothetical protein